MTATLVALWMWAVATPAGSCPVALVTPYVDVVVGEPPQLAVDIYAVGFSRSGHFAWVEQRRGEQDQHFIWSVGVADLNTNQRLLQQTFRTRGGGVIDLCKEHGSRLARALEPYGIEPGTGSILKEPSSDGDWLWAELRQGPRDTAKARTRFDVFLRARAGTRRLGSVWRPDPEEGQPATAPAVRAVARSELERRVAVLVTDASGPVRVFGAELVQRAARAQPLPEKLTQAWLRQLEEGAWSLDDVVDKARGLVVIHHEVDTPVENDPGRVSAQRLCGQDLTRQLPKLQTETIAEIRTSDATSCRNHPGPPMCVVGVLNEYTTFTYLIFLPGADGRLRLDAIVYVDHLAQVDAQEPHREQAEYVRTQLLRFRGTDCSGKAAVVPPDYRHLEIGKRD